jgi:uncharacterized protein (DUF305 family)
MKTLVKPILGLALVAAVGACGQRANKNDTVSDQNVIITSQTTSLSAPGDYDPVENKMGDEMTAAVGANAGDNWVRKMIAHHQGAIDMSKIVLDRKPTPEVEQMAKMTIDKQGHEIEDLKKLESQGAPDQKSADLYKPAMMEMQRAMMAAQGSTASETYLRKMLAHHEGALAMSDIALKNGVAGAVKEQVAKTKADQQKEVDSVKLMTGKS